MRAKVSVVMLALLFVASGAAAADKKPKRWPISGNMLEQLHAFTDGKGHFLIFPDPHAPSKFRGMNSFYGDGKVFYRLRTPQFSRNGKRYGFGVADPRARFPNNSMFNFDGQKPVFHCAGRKTVLTELPSDKALKLIKRAKFFDVYWNRQPHGLARDEDGRYYYVDRIRQGWSAAAHGTDFRGFRVFVGMRGKMKRVRMKNVVNDSGGQIFITNKGRLRLITGKSATWLLGKKKRVKLTRVSLRTTATTVMIYKQLGVYLGRPLKRPCDDL